MEKRIELERRGKSPNEIIDLNLDNCKSSAVIGLNEEYKCLRQLSLANVGVTTLKDFPKLPALEKLELSDNCISGGLHHLNVLPKLTHLNLSGNKISKIEVLEPLKVMSSLLSLDLINCSLSNDEKYRDNVFELLTNIVYLDGFDREDNELEDEDTLVNGESSNRLQNGVRRLPTNGVYQHDSDEDEEDDEEDEDDEDEEEDEERLHSIRGKDGGGGKNHAVIDEDDSDMEDEEEESGEEEEEGSDEEVPLHALYDTYDESADKDYEAVGEGSDDEEDIAKEEADTSEGAGRGKKRKFEEPKE